MFHETGTQQANAAVIDAQKPFATRRLGVYEQLTTLTAALAQLDVSPQIRKQKRQDSTGLQTDSNLDNWGCHI